MLRGSISPKFGDEPAFDAEARVRPLSVISLGLFPNKNAKVTSTVSAALMDVRNGYVYYVGK